MDGACNVLCITYEGIPTAISSHPQKSYTYPVQSFAMDYLLLSIVEFSMLPSNQFYNFLFFFPQYQFHFHLRKNIYAKKIILSSSHNCITKIKLGLFPEVWCKNFVSLLTLLYVLSNLSNSSSHCL